MNWVSIFLAALQILAKASPDVIAQFHGGARDTANKVSSALDVVNAVTTNLATGLLPLEGVGPIENLHPSLVAKAAAIDGAAEPGPTS